VTRIVCQQLAPVIGDLEANRVLSTAAIAQAVAAGADIVVLPELITSGYMFSSTAEAAEVAITAEHPLFENWRQAALKSSGGSGPTSSAVVVGGFCEAGADGRTYNSAVLIDGSGVRAVYRKVHLWDGEKLIFTPGDAVPPVVETAYGRIGVLVCFDLEFPEFPRTLALAGADLIAVPTNWPLGPRPAGERPAEVQIGMAAARTSRVFVACADRTGTERGQEWTGGTSIIDSDGWVVDAAGAGVGQACADLDLTRARDKKYTPLADVFADRRPDLYGAVTA
jgi:predicted amidohydrolase